MKPLKGNITELMKWLMVLLNYCENEKGMANLCHSFFGEKIAIRDSRYKM